MFVLVWWSRRALRASSDDGRASVLLCRARAHKYMQPLCAAQLSLLLLAAAAEETPGPLATPINAADMSTSSRSLSDERELALVQGTENYGDCRESATCRGEGFYCFKRAGGEYAQCRPRETTTCIEAGMWDPTRHSANDWLCPGWEYCAATHGDCAYAKCCQNAFDACFSRVSAPHTAHLHATRLTKTAVSSFLPHPTLTLISCGGRSRIFCFFSVCAPRASTRSTPTTPAASPRTRPRCSSRCPPAPRTGYRPPRRRHAATSKRWDGSVPS